MAIYFLNFSKAYSFFLLPVCLSFLHPLNLIVLLPLFFPPLFSRDYLINSSEQFTTNIKKGHIVGFFCDKNILGTVKTFCQTLDTDLIIEEPPSRKVEQRIGF